MPDERVSSSLYFHQFQLRTRWLLNRSLSREHMCSEVGLEIFFSGRRRVHIPVELRKRGGRVARATTRGAMAEEDASAVGESMVHANDGTRGAIEDNTATTKDSEDSNACALSSDPAPPRSEYFSTRIAALMASRTEFETALGTDIEASKVHWSELQAGNDGEGSSAEQNLEVFRSLQQQYHGPDGFFQDWYDDYQAVGEKIAEGAQGEICELRYLLPEDAEMNGRYVLKVFKLEGWSLRELQNQWPPGMLLNLRGFSKGYFGCASSAGIASGVMLSDRRFAFVMLRSWGDLRKVIDIRMQHNGNQAPPFDYHRALIVMYWIAFGMRGLHEDNIVHRDLKASNVLIDVAEGVSVNDFNPTGDDEFHPSVADFECSVGVVGTRFWRAPEILLGLKNRNVQPSLFTKKSDVYSYAMTCCEILTGKIPLEDIRANDYDAVINGARPVLPSDIDPWVQVLLKRCWHHDPRKRPSFKDIVNLLDYKMDSGLSKVFRSGQSC